MTWTRDILRAELRLILPSATLITDSDLNSWIASAIDDYSNHFPAYDTDTIPSVADTNEYTLGVTYCAGILFVLAVEYPGGEDPARALLWLSEYSPSFRAYPFYCVRGDPPHTLVLGEDTATGEVIIVRYARRQDNPANDVDPIYVPENHREVLKRYVLARALRSLEQNEAANPDSTSGLLSNFTKSADEAEKAYYLYMKYLKRGTDTGRAGPWYSDLSDRIY